MIVQETGPLRRVHAALHDLAATKADELPKIGSLKREEKRVCHSLDCEHLLNRCEMGPGGCEILPQLRGAVEFRACPLRLTGRRLAAYVLPAVIMTLTATAISFGKAPAAPTTEAPAMEQADAVAQNGSANGSPESSAPQQSTPQGATDNEKERLAVNPVTGIVTTPPSNYRPLTGKERWKLYWKQNYFSIGAYFGPVFTALVLDQATGSPAEWGGGLHGYGLRVASRTASAILQGTVQAPLAAILHEDVRYVASNDRRTKRRALHAVAYSFLTFNDQGHPTPNIANLGAYFASTAITTLWLPGKYNVARYTLTNSTEQIALTVPVNILQEFWPEVMHKVFRRPANTPQSSTASF